MNKNVLQAIKFTLFSLSAGIIQILSFALFNDLLPLENYTLTLANVAAEGSPVVFSLNLGHYWVSYLPSLVLSVLWNFTFNRKFTFKPSDHVGLDMALVAVYYVIFIAATVTLGNWLEAMGWHDWLIQLLNMVLNFVTEFLFQKYIVYPEEKTPA